MSADDAPDGQPEHRGDRRCGRGARRRPAPGRPRHRRAPRAPASRRWPTALVEGRRRCARGRSWVAHVPMDGFHLADVAARPARAALRKGAPDTFDADGYAHLLRRVVARTRTRGSTRPASTARSSSPSPPRWSCRRRPGSSSPRATTCCCPRRGGSGRGPARRGLVRHGGRRRAPVAPRRAARDLRQGAGEAAPPGSSRATRPTRPVAAAATAPTGVVVNGPAAGCSPVTSARDNEWWRAPRRSPRQPQRARRLSRSTSCSSTARASRRSQPRVAKSASALLTVSREAPTSCASSSWVRSWTP